MSGPLPRCSGCAFNPGTEANRQVHTRLMAELCAYLSHTFYCHANLDELTNQPRGKTEKRLCSGFVDRMNELSGAMTEEERPAFTDALLTLLENEKMGASDTEMLFAIGKVHRLTGQRLKGVK